MDKARGNARNHSSVLVFSLRILFSKLFSPNPYIESLIFSIKTIFEKRGTPALRGSGTAAVVPSEGKPRSGDRPKGSKRKSACHESVQKRTLGFVRIKRVQTEGSGATQRRDKNLVEKCRTSRTINRGCRSLPAACCYAHSPGTRATSRRCPSSGRSAIASSRAATTKWRRCGCPTALEVLGGKVERRLLVRVYILSYVWREPLLHSHRIQITRT